MQDITHVWIDDGCISCQACVGTAPAVFSIPGDSAVVLAEVRVDGRTSRNDVEHSPLNAIGLELSADIEEAAAGCPIDIIHVTRAA